MLRASANTNKNTAGRINTGEPITRRPGCSLLSEVKRLIMDFIPLTGSSTAGFCSLLYFSTLLNERKRSLNLSHSTLKRYLCRSKRSRELSRNSIPVLLMESPAFSGFFARRISAAALLRGISIVKATMKKRKSIVARMEINIIVPVSRIIDLTCLDICF